MCGIAGIVGTEACDRSGAMRRMREAIRAGTFASLYRELKEPLARKSMA